MTFDAWFQRAKGNDPFPYQRRFAEAKEIPHLLDVPNVPGKTALSLRSLACSWLTS